MVSVVELHEKVRGSDIIIFLFVLFKFLCSIMQITESVACDERLASFIQHMKLREDTGTWKILYIIFNDEANIRLEAKEI